MMPIILLIFSVCFILTGFWLYKVEQRRLPVLRFEHISDDNDYSSIVISQSSIESQFGDNLSEYKKLTISIVAVFLSIVLSVFFGVSLNKTVGIAIAAFGIAIIGLGQYQKTRKQKRHRQIAQMTPLVMERLVMAVDAGLDIVPAIKSVIEIDKLAKLRQKKLTTDHIVDALNLVIEIAERGTSFEEALKLVAKKYDNHALTHAFVHLGIAYKEGGELIGPLRELSDATQNYYQETIEEDLAKLPVKATAPLVLTFAGLILFFLSSPLVQIISFAAKAVPGK